MKQQKCYLIHFCQPIGSAIHKAQHYVGWTNSSLDERLQEHLSGKGARILAFVAASNIEVFVARVWDGSNRDFERWLKKQKNHKSFCPICSVRPRQPRLKEETCSL